MKFGYSRAVIACDSREKFGAVATLIKKVKGVWIDFWTCSDGGVFEGYIFAMDADEHQRFQNEMIQEQNRLESWWQRYHLANAETRHMMACGAIE